MQYAKRLIASPSAQRRKNQSGYTLIVLTASALAIFGIIGLAVDIGRVYIARNETQIYTDAAALAGAAVLDGTSAGITAANNAAALTANSWNLNSTNPTTATLEFAQTSSGPWSTSPANPAGYIYAKARLPVTVPLYFMPVMTQTFNQAVGSYSIAGQIAINSFSVGAAPYSLVSTSNAANFGLTVGGLYTIQWPQFNGTRSGCGAGNPYKCFNADPCSSDTKASAWAVASNWSSSTNGYWGFTSNSDITLSVMNGLQTAPVAVGDNILPIMTSGNKDAQGAVLDQRSHQDADTASDTPADYESSSTHNGRRVMLVPILNPVSPTVTTVLGFGAILLKTTSSNYYQGNHGNEGYCAEYLGPYTVGGKSSGGNTNGTGAFRPRLVE